MNDDEILDLVDGFDTVIGTIKRSEYNRMVNENLGYIRAVDLFLVNDNGEVWTPVRTPEKRIAPSSYDFSAAGHVETGEAYLEALIRETSEELNLELTEKDLEFVAKLKFPDVKYIDCIYVHRTNHTPEYNPEDYSSAEWLSPDALIQNIKNGHPAKGSLTKVLGVLEDYLYT